MEPFHSAPSTNPPWDTRQYLRAAASLLLGVSPILAILAEWLLAVALLGRKPVPGVDSPGSLSPVFSILHTVSAVFVYSPFLTTFLLPYLWWKRGERSQQTTLIAWGCLILPLASIYILRTDPTGITRWWLH
ncbi:hypothetical protein [Haloferula rosea]|uniref:Uncharacterized protein n=1 Tax=Haloferula rosea TaxID=490093 RepID=A0A934V9N4_9BACT|nr:hypothetical protein [Haloferula rosea]MBK1825423.1 hypothetical protein [Haloferula rosea]